MDDNRRGHCKTRPLHDAAAGGSLGAMKMLVGAGAGLTSTCEDYGGSALDIVKKKKEQDKRWKRKDGNREAEGDVAKYLEGFVSTGLPHCSKPVIEEHKTFNSDIEILFPIMQQTVSVFDSLNNNSISSF